MGLTYGVECLPLKNPEGLPGKFNSAEHFCLYEQKKYDFNRILVNLCFVK